MGAHIWSINNGFPSIFYLTWIANIQFTYRRLIVHQFRPDHDSHITMAFLSEEVKEVNYTFVQLYNCLIVLLINVICRSIKYENISLICVIALIELATVLMCIAMHNFSLALVTAVVYVPIILLITPHHGESASR